MKYIELISNFWEYNKKDSLGTSTIIFYFFLINKWYLKNEESFFLSDIEISKSLRINAVTIRSVKKILQEKGFINYQTRNGVPCRYEITSRFPLETLDEQNQANNPVIDVKTAPKQNTKKSKKVNKKTTNPTHIQSEVDKVIVKSNVLENNAKDIPSKDVFLDFAKKLPNFESHLENKIVQQYDIWLKNNWNNRLNRPITNWENSLKNILPYLLDEHSKELKKIPTIKPPSTSK